MDSMIKEEVKDSIQLALDENMLGTSRMALERSLAILTAEPEPCEFGKITQAEATLIETRDKIIRSAMSGQYQDADDALSAYASQVSDKREEDLRAQLDRANATLEEVAAQRNRAMEDIETLRIAINTALMFLKSKRDKDNLDTYMITSFEKSLASTEPKS